jgi:hypothetical protein
MGSSVVLVEINRTLPVPLAGLSVKDKLSAVGLTSPMGIAPRLTSIRLAEDELKSCPSFLKGSEISELKKLIIK